MIRIKNGQIHKTQKQLFGRDIFADVVTTISIENQPYIIENKDQTPETEQAKELVNFFQQSNKLKEFSKDVSAIMACASQLNRLSA
jgi:hypothetical protein